MTLATRNLMDSLRSSGEDHRRPEAVFPARPFGFSVGARPSHRAADPRRIRHRQSVTLRRAARSAQAAKGQLGLCQPSA